MFIENVGNLVCPALFDLGEAAHADRDPFSDRRRRQAPEISPYVLRLADLVIVNKIDLLPYVDFDIARCAQQARSINPSAEIVPMCFGHQRRRTGCMVPMAGKSAPTPLDCLRIRPLTNSPLGYKPIKYAVVGADRWRLRRSWVR